MSGLSAAARPDAQRLEAAGREYDRVLNAYVKGMISETDAEARQPELRAEKQRLEAELAAVPKPPKVVTLKPALVARYLRDLETLQSAIDAKGFVSDEAKTIVRNLVSKVTVYPPTPGEQPAVRIDGYLSNLVDDSFAQRVAVRGDRW